MQLSGNRRNALSGAEEEDSSGDGFQSQSQLCENKSDGARSDILDIGLRDARGARAKSEDLKLCRLCR